MSPRPRPRRQHGRDQEPSRCHQPSAKADSREEQSGRDSQATLPHPGPAQGDGQKPKGAHPLRWAQLGGLGRLAGAPCALGSWTAARPRAAGQRMARQTEGAGTRGHGASKRGRRVRSVDCRADPQSSLGSEGACWSGSPHGANPPAPLRWQLPLQGTKGSWGWHRDAEVPAPPCTHAPVSPGTQKGGSATSLREREGEKVEGGGWCWADRCHHVHVPPTPGTGAWPPLLGTCHLPDWLAGQATCASSCGPQPGMGLTRAHTPEPANNS